MDPLEEEAPGQANLDALDSEMKRADEVARRLFGSFRATGILGVGAGQDLDHPRRIADRAGQHPDVVQRPGLGHRAAKADQPVGRLEPHHATQRRGDAHAAPGVAADRDLHQPRGNRDGRATRGAAGEVRLIPGVGNVAEPPVDTERAERELVHVGAAEEDRPCRGEPRDYRRILRRGWRAQPGAGHRALPLASVEVLHCDERAGQRANHCRGDPLPRPLIENF